jgi:hypothetical protein
MEELMTIDFNDLLEVEEKQNILINRIKSFAAEGYQLTLNKKVAESRTDEGKEQAVAEIDANIEIIQNAINVYQNELSTLTDAGVKTK